LACVTTSPFSTRYAILFLFVSILPFNGVSRMSRSKNQRRKFTRNEKIFYFLSLLIIVSMVLGSIAALLAPGI